MAGAISLAGMACLRGGAGLVKLAVPDCILDLVAGFEASYMTVPLPCDSSGRIKLKSPRKLTEFIAPATCVACGPGLGRSKRLQSFVRSLYETLPQPMVIDADGLNALAAVEDGLANPAGPRILTPHPGEFNRLRKSAPEHRESRDEQVAAARELAAEHRVIIVLKGHRTIITDGSRTAENTTGNPGMTQMVESFANMGAPWVTGIDDIHALASEVKLRVIENFKTAELYRAYRTVRPSDSPIFGFFYSICTLGWSCN